MKVKHSFRHTIPRVAADICRPTRVISSDTRNRDVFELFEANPDWVSLPVTEDGHLVGMVNRDSFMRSMARPFHAEIFGKKRCSKLMDEFPVIADTATTIQDLASLLDEGGHGRSMADGFVIMLEGRAVGTGLARDVFQALMYLEKQAAQELRQHRNHLEDLVRERTAEVAKAEAHARLILESSADGLYGLDRSGRVTFVNPAACRILGHTPERMIGRSIHSLIHRKPGGDSVPEEDCPTFCALKEGAVVNAMDDVYWHVDGHPVPVLYSTHPIIQDGVRLGVVISFVDMTDREKFEAQRSLLAAIVSSSEDAIVGNTLDGMITTWNDGATRLFGFEPDEALGKAVAMVVPAELREEEMSLMVRLGAGDRVQPFETWRQRKDGMRVPVLITLSPIRDRNGQIVGASKILRDITLQKASQTAREKALLEAERLARVRSEFLANMSHEIRTPLNGVLGMAQVGLRDKEGHRAKEYFTRILGSGKLLLGVINDILDFSKIEAGHMGIESVPVNLEELLAQAMEMHQERARAKNITMRLEMSPGLPANCLSDHLRLAQILGNLMSNAVKFTEQGEVSLSAAREHGWLLFRVKDSGIGIRPEQLGRIFRAFEQADGSTTRRFGGTGLGLAITERIVDLMGGSIRVESSPGLGSLFEVRLPFVETSRTGKPVVLDPIIVGLAEPESHRLADIRVLVVEDNDMNRMVLEEMLQRDGASVLLAEDGASAVELLGKLGGDGFDIVLMDVQMPGMDGYETTRRIVEIAPGLPIVGQTAHAMAEDREKCLAAGMVDHLAKPIEEDALLSVILKHLPGDSGFRPARGSAMRFDKAMDISA
ncbi:MAG: PAS domain S-box protein [Rhodocyclaceae bacterium]|nr:PAS domain S-box protein [Rhodocyclaceae bacterium]